MLIEYERWQLSNVLGSHIPAVQFCLKPVHGRCSGRRTCRGGHCQDHLLAARQVASSVAAWEQRFRDGLCAGATGLVAQPAAGVAAGLQLMGAGLQALHS